MPVKPKSDIQIRLEERMRIASILSSPEGVARPRLAAKIACEMAVGLSEAVDMLRGYPVEDRFTAAMEREGQIGLGSFSPSSTIGKPTDPKEARLAEIASGMAAHNLAHGNITAEQAEARVPGFKAAKRAAR